MNYPEKCPNGCALKLKPFPEVISVYTAGADINKHHWLCPHCLVEWTIEPKGTIAPPRVPQEHTVGGEGL